MFDNLFRYAGAVCALSIVACSSGPQTEDASENVAQADSALQSTAALTGAITQSTRAAYHFLGSARDARTSGCAKFATRLVPRGVFVSADFGAGCEIPVLGSVSGSVAMTFTAERGALAFDASYASFTLAGVTLTGSTSLAATGRQMTLAMDLTSTVDGKSSHVVLDGTSVRDGSALGATLSGSGSFRAGNANAVGFSAADLHVALGACYADAGTLSIDPATVTFLPTTPSDGVVTLKVLGLTSSSTLPSYGRCPR